jgi:hypothetical protein
MNIPAPLEPLIGDWAGSGSLWFNPAEPAVATFQSRASIAAVAQANLISLTYTWAYEDDPQEGIVLIGVKDNGEVQASWLDSWHMQDDFMISKGPAVEPARVAALGAYDAPSGPPWGWRTVFDVVSSTEWFLRMYNIMPGGDDMLAFEIHYERV